MTLEQAAQLAEACLLPPLKVRIGDQLISTEHFQDIQPVMIGSMRQLLDTFHANEFKLLEVDVNTLEFRKLFLMAICEQAAPQTVYQIQDPVTVAGVAKVSNRLLPKVISADRELEKVIFEYFNKKLTKEEWRRNLGAIYGFHHYCMACFSGEADSLTLDTNGIQFVLARALWFSDHFEPEFHVIALGLFNILLNPKHVAVARDMNVHKVIYTEALKMVDKAKEIEYIQRLWTCLYTCIYIDESERTNFKVWSAFDETFEQLMIRLGFEDDKKLALLYMNTMIRFMQMGRDEKTEGEAEEVVERLRAIKQPNYRIFRWVEKLLCLLQNDAFKLGGDNESVLTYLHVSD